MFPAVQSNSGKETAVTSRQILLTTLASFILSHSNIERHKRTQCGPKVLGLMVFLNRIHTRKIHSFFIQNKLRWHIHRLLLKILLFGAPLIHQLRLLGSQQQPQSGILLTSFSTSGKETSLTEINLRLRGGDDKGS